MNKNVVKYTLISLVIVGNFTYMHKLLDSNKTLGNELVKTKQVVSNLTVENQNFSTQVALLNNQLVKMDNQMETMSKELSALKANPFVYYSPNNLLVKSNVTVNQLEKVFKGTNMEGLEPFIVNAEKVHGVNAFFIAGLVATESTWGGSERAIKQNNLTGHGVHISSSRGSVFNSKESSIMNTANMLKHEYLTQSGKFYNGTSIWAVNMRYSLHPNKTINTQWATTINSIAMGFKNKINK